MQKLNVLIISSLLLSSCGGGNHHSGAYKKQRTPADIKIKSLDLKNKTISLLLDYRSYIPKILEDITCRIQLNNDNIVISDTPKIALGAFAKESLDFTFNEDLGFTQENSITYSMDCELNYDNGKRFISKESRVFLVPGSNSNYR